MNSTAPGATPPNAKLLRALTCVMFLMFAMTSDAVGSIIPKVIEEFQLSLKEAGAFHYVPIEGVGLPPAWRAIWERFMPVAVTESGADAIEAVYAGDRARANAIAAALDARPAGATHLAIRATLRRCLTLDDRPLALLLAHQQRIKKHKSNYSRTDKQTGIMT